LRREGDPIKGERGPVKNRKRPCREERETLLGREGNSVGREVSVSGASLPQVSHYYFSSIEIVFPFT
jgi:hypothetical protein